MKLHCAPAPSDDPHVLLLMTNSPTLLLVITNPPAGLPPVLVTVSVCMLLAWPTVTFPNDSEAGAAESAAGVCVETPVPDNAMGRVLPPPDIG